MHSLRLRGVHERARSAASHLQAGQRLTHFHSWNLPSRPFCSARVSKHQTKDYLLPQAGSWNLTSGLGKQRKPGWIKAGTLLLLKKRKWIFGTLEAETSDVWKVANKWIKLTKREGPWRSQYQRSQTKCAWESCHGVLHLVLLKLVFHLDPFTRACAGLLATEMSGCLRVPSIDSSKYYSKDNKRTMDSWTLVENDCLHVPVLCVRTPGKWVCARPHPSDWNWFKELLNSVWSLLFNVSHILVFDWRLSDYDMRHIIKLLTWTRLGSARWLWM